TILSAFLLYSSLTPRHLHSFPTRRSSDLTVTGLILVPLADLPSTSRTVSTGTTTSWSIAPPWTNRAPPAKWKRLAPRGIQNSIRSEEHTSELQSRENLVCRLLLEKKNNKT